MAASSNPMVEFLTAPENVKAVLEILRNQREIQRQLALRFWKRFQESLESAKPPEFNLLFKNDIERRDDAAPYQRNPEEQLQRDGRPDHLRQIARRDGDFAEYPEKPNRQC